MFQQVRHLTIFFISFKIKPDVTFVGFTTKYRIFTPFWYQSWKNCKVVLPIKIRIWLKYCWNLLMCYLTVTCMEHWWLTIGEQAADYKTGFNAGYTKIHSIPGKILPFRKKNVNLVGPVCQFASIKGYNSLVFKVRLAHDKISGFLSISIL